MYPDIEIEFATMFFLFLNNAVRYISELCGNSTVAYDERYHGYSFRDIAPSKFLV